MNELQRILNAYDLAQSEKRNCALATVIFVKGSSYRRAGARMLVNEDGQWVGCVSGGCLERDLLRQAFLAIDKGAPEIVRYDTSEDRDEESGETSGNIGAGLGCNGHLEILIEPIFPNTPHRLLEKFKVWSSQASGGGVLFTLPVAQNEFVFWTDGVFEGLEKIPEIFRKVVEEECLKLPPSSSIVRKDLAVYENRITVFIEPFHPPTKVTLIGAGYDAVEAASLAVHLGHEVEVIDMRSSMPLPRNAFVGIKKYIQCSPSDVQKHLRIDKDSVVIVMTHNADHDLIVLPTILKATPAYIGLLGPKVRGQKLLDECRKKTSVTREIFENVYFPTGLDIGAETPKEIALSVFAEVNAVLKGRPGGSLKDRVGAIHERPA